MFIYSSKLIIEYIHNPKITFLDDFKYITSPFLSSTEAQKPPYTFLENKIAFNFQKNSYRSLNYH